MNEAEEAYLDWVVSGRAGGPVPVGTAVGDTVKKAYLAGWEDGRAGWKTDVHPDVDEYGNALK